jgi:IS30 family transposase
LSSTRRVRKGPGRRPLSAKRERFTQLRARRWTVAAARRDVGVSRTTGANWTRGTKVYRKGQIVGFVQPLERLEVRAISARYLSQEERLFIADLRRQGLSVRAIAGHVGRSPSTVSRELRRNQHPDGSCRPFEAHRQAVLRRAEPRQRRLEANLFLRALVGQFLAQRWSPSQIARHLRARFPRDAWMRVCHETIYQAIYQPGSTIAGLPRVPSPGHPSPLRTGRDHRRAQRRTNRRRTRFAQPMLSIHERPLARRTASRPVIGKETSSSGAGRQRRSARSSSARPGSSASSISRPATPEPCTPR